MALYMLLCTLKNEFLRRDSTDGRAAALYPADPGSNPVVSMLQHALRLSVSAGRQTQLIMNRSWSRTLIVALLHWLDYKTLQLLLLFTNLFEIN